MPIHYIYTVHTGVTNIFCYISRSDHCEVLWEMLVLKIWQKDKSRILEAVIFFQGFLKTSFAEIFRNIHFF